eukprot:scaffold65_cov353-Prasinococcus_capsulatus_cf.AAC.20
MRLSWAPGEYTEQIRSARTSLEDGGLLINLLTPAMRELRQKHRLLAKGADQRDLSRYSQQEKIDAAMAQADAMKATMGEASNRAMKALQNQVQCLRVARTQTMEQAQDNIVALQKELEQKEAELAAQIQSATASETEAAIANERLRQDLSTLEEELSRLKAERSRAISAQNAFGELENHISDLHFKVVRYCEPDQLYANPLAQRGGHILYSSSESMDVQDGTEKDHHDVGPLLDRTNSNGPLLSRTGEADTAPTDHERFEEATDVFHTPLPLGKENANIDASALIPSCRDSIVGSGKHAQGTWVSGRRLINRCDQHSGGLQAGGGILQGRVADADSGSPVKSVA